MEELMLFEVFVALWSGLKRRQEWEQYCVGDSKRSHKFKTESIRCTDSSIKRKELLTKYGYSR